MKGFLTRLLITALGLWAAKALVTSIWFHGWGDLVIAALLLGIVNALVRPVLVFLTLPFTILTLGLFLLVVNGISLGIVAWLMPGFAVGSLWSATVGALIVSVVSWFASAFIGGSGRMERFPGGRRIEVTGRRLD